MRAHRPALCSALLLAASLWGGASQADEIAVGNYAVSANGMPYAVAMAKGFFKEEGADVTGIISSGGGGTSLRNMLTGTVAFGEVNPGAVISAIQQGADLKIISDDVLTVAEFVWAVKLDSPIKTIKDLKGKKFGYTNPRSTSQALATMVLEKGGLKTEDVELVKTGGFGEGVAALDIGVVDIAPVPEPLWSEFRTKYRPIAVASELLPPLANVVGVSVTSPTPAKAEFVRAVIRARRKAVTYMEQHPDEAGDIVAKVYNLDPAIARNAVHNLITSRTAGVEYWGSGQIHLDGIKLAIDVQKSVGAITGDVDAKSIVDTQFLPDDIKALK